MDQERFDRLSRRLGASQSRRQALRTLAGALMASVAAVKASAEANATIAPGCVSHYGACGSDGQCCDGAVCQWGMCMPGCRIEGQFAHPGTSPAGNICQVCHPDISTSTGSAVNEGIPCWNGDPFAGSTVCQNGICAPEGPVSCPPLTACHLEGTVNPANGLCVNPPAAAGTPCGGWEACYGGIYSPGAACDGNGNCLSGGTKSVSCAPYTCAGTACATSCTGDGDCTNGAACCDGQCVYLNTIVNCGSCGYDCQAVDSCTPAACDDGVCVEESACAPGLTCCTGECASLTDDPDHCGACGNACRSVDACTPAACNGGACNETSACTAPEHGTATCGVNGCGFVCDEGYKPNEAGNACEVVPLCPAGYQPLHNACFLIVNTAEERSQCKDVGCNWFGSVVDSPNYLCGTENPTARCTTTNDCPSGQACFTSLWFCFTPCP